MNANFEQVKAVFLEAVEKPAGRERDAYLVAACAGNDALRQQVDVLLLAHESGSLLDKGALAGSPTADSPTMERPGTQIGPYKLLQLVGEGGMGTVWMAEQHEPVRRRVALKLIKPGMDSRQVLARFEAERQALSMMDHPNIAKVLDAGTAESGRPYFVMELVKGQPITQYCDEQRLSPRERLELFLPVCHAIQHAHQKGIIHRDIKPSNVLVAEYDGRPVAKVIDFGVAKAIHQSLTEKTMFTGLGQIIGTLEYMSPEQARVNQLDVDTRSDIYSLGVLLYELLTGSTPFDKQRLRNAALDELLRIIREEEPLRPSTRLSSSATLPNIAASRRTEAARLSTLVRGELDWIVMKALEKDRNRRYETANGFAQDIQRYLADERVAACPPSASYLFRKFARRHRTWLMASTAVAVTLVLGLVGTSWQAVRALHAEKIAMQNLQRALRGERAALSAAEAERQAREREQAQRAAAEQARQQAMEEAAVARAVSEFLQQDLLGMAGAESQMEAELEPDPDIKLSTLFDRALKYLDVRFSDQGRVKVEVQRTLAAALRSIGRYHDSAQLYAKVRDYHERALGRKHPETIRSLGDVAASYRLLGDLEQALSLSEELVGRAEAVWGPEHPDTLGSRSDLAGIYYEMGRLESAIKLSERTFQLRQRVLGPEHRDTLRSMILLALTYQAAKQPERALPLIERAVELQTSLGDRHPDRLKGLHLLATTYWKSGQLEKALPLMEQTLEAKRAILGSDHPETLQSMNGLGILHADAGRTAEALALLDETLELKIAKLGPEHPSTLNTMNNLAVVYRAAGRTDEAVALLQRTLDVRTRNQGPEHPNTLQSLHNLALAFQDAGRADEALRLARVLAERWKSLRGPEASETLEAMGLLELALYNLQRWTELEPLLRESLAIREATQAEAWTTFRAQSMLGGTLVGQQKLGEAESLLLSGYEGMKQRESMIPEPDRVALNETLRRLVELYQALEQPGEAAKWQTELDQREPPPGDQGAEPDGQAM